MNIAMMHFRVGETDGVSLEMDKWKLILEKNGHKVCYIAGSEGTSKCHVVKEMYYRDAYDLELNKALFEELGPYTEATLKEAVLAQSERIREQLVYLFVSLKIDLVIPNNLLCLGRSPHIAIALTNAILETGVKVIGHHHDFYWERDYFKSPVCAYAKELLETYFPPNDLPTMQHAVINTLAKRDLEAKKGLKSKVVPNVFDFNMPSWVKDDYNSSYKADMGIKDNEVVFLQATRVTNRKAIELAIDLLAVLNQPTYRQMMIGQTLYNGQHFTEDHQLVLVLVGLHEGLEGYETQLIKHAKSKGVKMLVKPDLVDHQRHLSKGKKIYSLWDAYVYSDMITYPSIYEGWGNQFLEGLFAKKPQIVFEYSIFESDIKAFGFDYISLGNTYKMQAHGLATIERKQLESAAEATIDYLFDAEKYVSAGEKNYEIGKKSLSLESLESLVMALLDGC